MVNRQSLGSKNDDQYRPRERISDQGKCSEMRYASDGAELLV